MARQHHNANTTESLALPEDECRVLHVLRRTPEILDLIAGGADSALGLQAILRRRYPNDLVRAALSLHELRQKAPAKFVLGHTMWIDRLGLEQSTSEVVARHKSRRFSGVVWDLCCGIGGDAMALSDHCHVTAVDRNPAACLRTTWNAELYGVGAHIETITADISSLTEIPGLVHVDPDRRAGSGGRVSRIEDYEPGLGFLQDLMTRCRGGAIKVGPASNFGGKFDGVEIELVSLAGECKEATLWFGELAGEAPFRATSLPTGETIAGHPLDCSVPITRLGRLLFDPDPAVVRSGLVDLVADRHGLNRLDGAEEYLTGDSVVNSAFVDSFEVLADLPNNDREVRGWLRTSDFGEIEIKCRHIPIQAEAVRRRLPLPGNKPGVLFYARCDGKARAIMARRIKSDDGGSNR